MTIEKSIDGTKVNVKLIGEIDALSAASAEKTLMKDFENATYVTCDLQQLEYISSSGLRMLLNLQKMMKKRGEMVIANPNSEIMEVFTVTGFSRLLNII